MEEYSTAEIQMERAKKIKPLTAGVRQVLRAILLAEEWREIDYLTDENEFSDGHLVMMSICLLGEQIEAAVGVIYGTVDELVLKAP